MKEAKAHKITLMQLVEKNRSLLESKRAMYQKIAFDYDRYHKALHDHSVPEVTVQNMLKEKNSMFAEVYALTKELKLTQQEVITQSMKIESLEAVRGNAKVNLDETTVYAKNNGIVQNMFVSLGTPIKLLEPVFSFIDTDSMFIQANFNETDLRYVKPGSKVTIYPRIYIGSKRYHGVVVSQNWAANRQLTDHRSQEQQVANDVSNWLLLPQRLPVQIKIIDYDADYPLSIGTSVYVYIHV